MTFSWNFLSRPVRNKNLLFTLKVVEITWRCSLTSQINGYWVPTFICTSTPSAREVQNFGALRTGHRRCGRDRDIKMNKGKTQHIRALLCCCKCSMGQPSTWFQWVTKYSMLLKCRAAKLVRCGRDRICDQEFQNQLQKLNKVDGLKMLFQKYHKNGFSRSEPNLVSKDKTSDCGEVYNIVLRTGHIFGTFKSFIYDPFEYTLNREFFIQI